jgi:uracil-DNA glycosylase
VSDVRRCEPAPDAAFARALKKAGGTLNPKPSVIAAPKAVVIMGHIALEMLLGEASLTRARGTWASISNARALVMLPPRILLQTPAAKRDTWADALALKAMLRA